tara:strand:- start:1302 stop:1490 length:189 start_codon:yes stop_codon:yes gene_type:complete
MKIDDLLYQLKAIRKTHGNLDIEVLNTNEKDRHKITDLDVYGNSNYDVRLHIWVANFRRKRK